MGFIFGPAYLPSFGLCFWSRLLACLPFLVYGRFWSRSFALGLVIGSTFCPFLVGGRCWSRSLCSDKKIYIIEKSWASPIYGGRIRSNLNVRVILKAQKAKNTKLLNIAKFCNVFCKVLFYFMLFPAAGRKTCFFAIYAPRVHFESNCTIWYTTM